MKDVTMDADEVWAKAAADKIRWMADRSGMTVQQYADAYNALTPEQILRAARTKEVFGSGLKNWPGGHYLGTCCGCKERFMGPKRALLCWPCEEVRRAEVEVDMQAAVAAAMDAAGAPK